MPAHQSYPSLMADQVYNWIVEGFCESTVGDLPYFDSAILRATGNDIIIVRTPLDVKDSGFVTWYDWGISFYSTSLKNKRILSFSCYKCSCWLRVTVSWLKCHMILLEYLWVTLELPYVTVIHTVCHHYIIHIFSSHCFKFWIHPTYTYSTFQLFL